VTELRGLVVRWQRGWGVARGVPPAEDVGGGLRVHCRQNGREVEYFAPGEADLERLAKLVLQEEAVTWLTVVATDPSRAAATLQAAGLILLKRAEQLMTVDLRAHPRREPPAPYRVETRLEDAVVRVEVIDGSGVVGASGTAGLTGPDAIADRIGTVPEHRRRGLGSVVMSALVGAALAEGAGTGLLIASEDGRHLYASLGWRPVAEVLIAAPPGTGYPS
jgi:GNAT superfamily N-acetyltransferase